MQHIRLVGLPNIEQLLRSGQRILGKFEQRSPYDDRFLRCERLIVGHRDSILNAEQLFFAFCFRLSALLLEHTLSRSEFASESDVLLNEPALLTTALRASANLLSLIPDRRIGVEPCLPFSAFGCADFRLCLFECGIVFNGRLLQLLQREHWTGFGSRLFCFRILRHLHSWHLLAGRRLLLLRLLWYRLVQHLHSGNLLVLCRRRILVSRLALRAGHLHLIVRVLASCWL